MDTTPTPENNKSYSGPDDVKWSAAEKSIAHKAFNLALERELNEAMREAKDRAARIAEPAELWELERYLTQRRLQFDRKYDYRYSVLLIVFANLRREGRLSEQDLRGLSEEKLSRIRLWADL